MSSSLPAARSTSGRSLGLSSSPARTDRPSTTPTTQTSRQLAEIGANLEASIGKEQRLIESLIAQRSRKLKEAIVLGAQIKERTQKLKSIKEYLVSTMAYLGACNTNNP